MNFLSRVKAKAHRMDSLPKRNHSRHIAKHSKTCGVGIMKTVPKLEDEREMRDELE